MPRCATWRRATASCRCRPRCDSSTRETREVVPIFDRQLGKTRSLAGDGMTATNLFPVPVLFYFPDIPEIRAIANSAPNSPRWARDMEGRPSVKATEPQQAAARRLRRHLRWLSVVCNSIVQTALAGVIAPRFGIVPRHRGEHRGGAEALRAGGRHLRQASGGASFPCRGAADGGRSLPGADLFLFS